MMSPNALITTFNGNGLNFLVKRLRPSNQIQTKQEHTTTAKKKKKKEEKKNRKKEKTSSQIVLIINIHKI